MWAGLKQHTSTSFSREILPFLPPARRIGGSRVPPPAMPTWAVQKSCLSSVRHGAWSVATTLITPSRIPFQSPSLSSLRLIGGLTLDSSLSVLSVFSTRYWGQVSASTPFPSLRALATISTPSL